MNNPDAVRVLDFWFENNDKWYVKSPEFDQLIRDNFLELYKKALSKELDSWTGTPQETLALIIVLDQFSRNMFRDKQEMYAGDDYALELSHIAMDKGYDKQLEDSQRSFIYMPLMHSEKLSDQDLSVEMFSDPSVKGAYEYAVMHRDIVVKFGRFPHRNEILNRKSTDEEIEFLKQPGSSF